MIGKFGTRVPVPDPLSCCAGSGQNRQGCHACWKHLSESPPTPLPFYSSPEPHDTQTT